MWSVMMSTGIKLITRMSLVEILECGVSLPVSVVSCHKVSLTQNISFWPKKLTRNVSFWSIGFLGLETDP